MDVRSLALNLPHNNTCTDGTDGKDGTDTRKKDAKSEEGEGGHSAPQPPLVRIHVSSTGPIPSIVWPSPVSLATGSGDRGDGEGEGGGGGGGGGTGGVSALSTTLVKTIGVIVQLPSNRSECGNRREPNDEDKSTAAACVAAPMVVPAVCLLDIRRRLDLNAVRAVVVAVVATAMERNKGADAGEAAGGSGSGGGGATGPGEAGEAGEADEADEAGEAAAEAVRNEEGGSIRLASPSELVDVFGFVPGTLGPLGLRHPHRTIVILDQALDGAAAEAAGGEEARGGEGGSVGRVEREKTAEGRVVGEPALLCGAGEANVSIAVSPRQLAAMLRCSGRRVAVADVSTG